MHYIRPSKSDPAHTQQAQNAIFLIASHKILPVGALLLTGSLSAAGQPLEAPEGGTLRPVVVKDHAEAPSGKDALRTTTTQIGKGTLELRDIPQSLTVVTEKLIDDKNLDTLKDVLHHTAGVTFQAAEGGEEDIRLRGFSLATTGDIFIDGMRDPAFYERDTFNNDRIELLRGSASMLFGRGSTGGVVNQVSKSPRISDEKEVALTLGSYNYRRLTGDFNLNTGMDSALRINAMTTTADSNAAGSSLDKRGIATAYRTGSGTSDELFVTLFSLVNKNGVNYGMPWIKPTALANVSTSSINGNLYPNAYYGAASDYNNGSADYLTLNHIHRFQHRGELRTTLRKGRFTRDMRASAIRMAAGTGLDNFSDTTVLTRGNNNKIQDLDSSYAQSDYTLRLDALGLKHEIATGVDLGTESKRVFAVSAATKPSTLVGTPSDGGYIDEAARVRTVSSAFEARNLGIYVQDLLEITPHWKALAGLRYDSMRGAFDTFNTANAVTASYAQTIDDWSERAGLLYQPDELHSYHFSYGTSFNTSADTYSYAANTANAEPEQSRNIEFGAKLDSRSRMYSLRFALFHSAKLDERNTDPESAANTQLLSGRRSTAGAEIDITGRITPKWEIYGSYMWMPHAMVDAAAPCPSTGACAQSGEGSRVGDRPALTPVHSGTVWATYQTTASWRIGAGINFRSAQFPIRTVSYTAPAYSTVDLMSEYRFNDHYLLRVNATNVGNTLYADALYPAFYVPGPGRNIQVTLTAAF